MICVYVLEVEGPEDLRSNSSVFKLIQEYNIPEDCVFMDSVSKGRSDLTRLFDKLQEGDRLIVRSVKDLAITSVKDLVGMLWSFKYIGVELVSIEENFLNGRDYAETTEKFIDLLDYCKSEKRKAAYDRAVSAGKVGRKAVEEKRIQKAMELYNLGVLSVAEILKVVGVSRSTFYKYLRQRGKKKNEN